MLDVIVGVVVSQLVVGLVVGLPILLLTMLLQSYSEPGILVGTLIAAVAGSVVAGWIGVALASRTGLSYWFAAGAGLFPLTVGLRMLSLFSSGGAFGFAMISAYVLASAALPVGFIVRRRGAPA